VAEQVKQGVQAGFEPIDAAMRNAVETGAVAGVVALGATTDGVVYEGAFGKADVRSGTAMSRDTIFWIASMTKAITATACMQLVEQGRLSLDQPAAEVLTELASPQILEGFDLESRPKLRPAKRPITVRHLLTHTSGYTYALWSEAMARYEDATGTPSIFTAQKAAFSVPLEFEPGERWQYGISIDWVGRIVEAISGQSLEAYFHENIFAPLGMRDTGYLISAEQRRRVASFGLRQPDGTLKFVPYESPQCPEFFMGGAGLFSTPADYMAFLQMLLHGGRFRGETVLKPETVSAMMTNQIGDLAVGKMISTNSARSLDFDQFPGMPHKWGLSFDINERPGPCGRSAGSISWSGAFNTHYWLDPVRKVAGVLFTQVQPFFDDRVIALYGAFERGLYDGLARG
jgi:CubicO group peptidase (beta-lactamase class C family)